MNMTLFREYLKAFLLSVIGLSLTNFAKSEGADTCPNIIERAQWGARPSKAVNYLVTPLLYVVIHHTGTPECSRFSECADIVRSIQNDQMNDQKRNDIGFSFMVGGDGNVYEGTGWFTEGSHTKGYDKKSISIAFIGNYQHSYRNSTIEITIDKNIPERALKAAHDLIHCGQSQGHLRQNVKVIGARQVMVTESPGNKLYAYIQRWPEWTVVPRRQTMFS